jgi:phytoene dehydrogenase-like protein
VWVRDEASPNRSATPPDGVDVLVVGAGHGGLGAALALAERGLRVRLHEALSYPGGCASTFRRGGARFDAGATLCAGLGDGELFSSWLARYGLEVPVEAPDPLMTYVGPELTLPLWRDRARVVDALCALPGAPVEGLRSYFEHQRAVGDALWPMLRDPDLLPPWTLSALARHAARPGALWTVAGVAGRRWSEVLARHGVAEFEPLRGLLRSMGQITVQGGPDEVDAAVAMSAAELPWRGAAHVRGGIGRLAEALAEAVRRAGGDVRLADRVVSASRVSGGWSVQTRSGTVRARALVLNVLPEAARALLGAPSEPTRALSRLEAGVAGGYAASTAYWLIGDHAALPREAAHGLLVDDGGARTAGHQVFASLSEADEPGRADPGLRVVTVSTHVDAASADPAQQQDEVQERMRATVQRRWPELLRDVRAAHPASPRTWERFARRPGGRVGGPVRRAGFAGWLHLGPERVADGVWLVGDSVMPGQSTLAAAISGVRAAAAAGAWLGV